MRLNAFLIVTLLVIVITAPAVDAIACGDCNDSSPLRAMPQQSSNPVQSEQQEAGAAQDLCPVCANLAAAMDSACCDAPSLTSHMNPLLKLLAFSAPSYTINKPPQN